MASTSCLFADKNVQAAPKVKAKRIVFLCSSLGFLRKHFFPDKSGFDYRLSPHLEYLSKLKKDFTVFSGLSHHGLLGSLHQSERCFLTAAQKASSPSFKNSISIDQVIATQIGSQTRYASLNLSLGDRGLVHNRAGVMVPPQTNVNILYNRLFKEKAPSQIKKEKEELQIKRKILINAQKQIGRESTVSDKYKRYNQLLINEYEKQISWLDQPTPKVSENLPFKKTHDAELLKRYENFLTTIRLAFQTDSTRTAVLHIPFYNKVPLIEKVDTSWHRLTHKQNVADKLKQLIYIEQRVMKLVTDFLMALKNTSMGNHNLLDETIVLLGSNLGESNSHNPTNLPILVAGGPFQHGQHLVYSKTDNEALSKLYLSLANSIEGVKLNKFKGESDKLKNFV